MENLSPGFAMKTTNLNFERPPPPPCCNVGGGFGSFAEIWLSWNDGVNLAELGGGGGRVKTMVVFIADPGPPDPSD